MGKWMNDYIHTQTSYKRMLRCIIILQIVTYKAF